MFQLEHGFCANLFRECVLKHELILSEHILTELRRHLAGKTRLTTEKLDQIGQTLRATCVMVEPAPLPADSCRDADDVAILGSAIAGKADAVVTGDKDLLILKTFQSIPILTPREFHNRFVMKS